MGSVSKSISIPNEEFLDDNFPSVARKFLNEFKSTIVTLQCVVKQKMTLDIHNWSSFAHQELLKILKDEIHPIVNQVDTKVQNFEIQSLKEAAKFVRDFKSLTNKAGESVAKHKALEFEIELFMRAIVSQDIMSIVQNPTVVDTIDLQTELEPYKDMQQKIELLQAQLGDHKGKSKDTPCVSATLDPLSQKLEDENVELEFQNDKYEVVYAMCKQCLFTANHDFCILNYVNGINTRDDNQSENVSNVDNQKKHKPTVKKPKKLGPKERLASPKPSKPISCLRWSPTIRIFDLKGKIIESSESECQSDSSNGDNAYLEVAFRRNSCFVRNLEGVDLLKGNHTTNLYSINLHEMASASPICLMARATSTNSWLWHQHLSHLNFDTINELDKNDLVTGLLLKRLLLCATLKSAPSFINDREDIGKLGAKAPQQHLLDPTLDRSLLPVKDGE
ncbi:retrovirus-related pol polyprotein from transposon TNT 1-94 [Tanacetum coccineum]|uniref:Retrovirus-related pol polyprotein from transposon TNT 1-94 n=1 Tax=Tanacetum coccineum TaxID=301880 RepID=A0ABQ5B0A7_9ASTR